MEPCRRIERTADGLFEGEEAVLHLMGRGGWRCCPSETRTLPRSGPYGGGSGRALPGRLSGGPGAVAAGWIGAGFPPLTRGR